MFYPTHISLFFTIFFIGKSLSVSVSQKCDMSDGKCKMALYSSMVQSVAGGLPESKIPSIDPCPLKDVTAKLAEDVQFILVDTVVTGLKDCSYDNFNTNIDHQHSVLNITCNFDVEGQYKVVVPGKVISKLGGSGAGGEFSGKGKLKVENVHMNLDFPFYMVRRDDDIYIEIRYYHGFGIWAKSNDKTVFSSDDLGLENKDLNDKLVAFLNKNSNGIEDAVTAAVVEKTNEFYHAFCVWFFNSIPANNFLSGDLTQYIKE